MRNIILYSNPRKHYESAGMRGFQIWEQLKEYYKCDVDKNMDNIKNSIVIFLKDNYGVNRQLLEKSKKQGNINIMDIIDLVYINPDNENDYHDLDLIDNGWNEFIDYYIVNNSHMVDYYTKKYKKFCYPIPHQYDPRLESVALSRPKNKKLEFLFSGFVGHTNKNCLYINELKRDYKIKFCDKFDDLISKPEFYNCDCHISIRKEGSWEYIIKPAMKLANAAALGANIITSYDMSVRDLIPKDYPYLLLEDDYESVKKMFDYVIKTYNTEIWFKGLKIMSDVRKILSVKRIVKKRYRDLLKKVGKE